MEQLDHLVRPDADYACTGGHVIANLERSAVESLRHGLRSHHDGHLEALSAERLLGECRR